MDLHSWQTEGAVIDVLHAIMWKWSECRVMYDVKTKKNHCISLGQPQLRWLVIRFSQWRPMFAPRTACVETVMEKATLRQILLETLQFCRIHFIPPMLHIHSSIIHKNGNCSITGYSSTEPFCTLFKDSLLLLNANMSVWMSYQTQTQNLFLQAINTNTQALYLHQPGRVG